MMSTIYKLLIPLLFILVLNACNAQKIETENLKIQSNEAFNKYWFQGLAEVSSYELKQARYGEIREGEAILVFVTEDFLTKEQVKKESNTKSQATKVLKVNHSRKFTSGIYDYSMMNSTFSNIHQEKVYLPLKVSTSSQEWCGHSWMQLNKYSSSYMLSSYSYFEKEGDFKSKIKSGILEDGIWNQIRLNPDLIKEGEQLVFPSTFYIRLAHIEPIYYSAIIKKEKYLGKDYSAEDIMVLQINYPDLDRIIKIIYTKNPPFDILGWEETSPSRGKLMTTTAKRKAKILSPYWSKNSRKDSTLRNQLLLKH